MDSDICIKYIAKELLSAKYNLKQAHLRRDANAVERLRIKIDTLTEIHKRLGGAYDEREIKPGCKAQEGA